MSEIVDLSKLPAPQVLEELDYEQLLAERKAKFISFYPDEEQPIIAARLELESEPIVKLLEENCYLQLLERQRINNAAKATMLAYATGTDLDVIAANFNVQRLVIQEEDLSATPPQLEILESDEDFRLRIQLKFESLSSAGPRKAYSFYALSADGKIGDVSIYSPEPAHVDVILLNRQGKGEVTQEIINKVANILNDEEIRPIADRVSVKSVAVVDYQIEATLYLFKGPQTEPIKQEAQANINKLINKNKRIGRDITQSAIHHALKVEGVQNVKINKPSADIVLDITQAGYCTSVNLTWEFSDEYS
ncbi:baseplate J/gp47 family protein [Actinobacillus equuli subsp. equuli]|uniref:Baseplate J/gp47 family protein n=1 Tax=Actinobacillus equuli subsp. equuli TaxID=202947 RepID=A0A9X4G3B5_ACTEU|nr:baseplate J/gp47 family protein [Actinobacillus equuli]MDE8034641.1 baseplate J/gp47 family protein [Actinobacillus equuli subsp. equuli]